MQAYQRGMLEGYLHSEEFHSLCMDYRGAVLPTDAQHAYEELKMSIRRRFIEMGMCQWEPL
jgi:hypothetical protein